MKGFEFDPSEAIEVNTDQFFKTRQENKIRTRKSRREM